MPAGLPRRGGPAEQHPYCLRLPGQRRAGEKAVRPQPCCIDLRRCVVPRRSRGTLMPAPSTSTLAPAAARAAMPRTTLTVTGGRATACRRSLPTASASGRPRYRRTRAAPLPSARLRRLECTSANAGPSRRIGSSSGLSCVDWDGRPLEGTSCWFGRGALQLSWNCNYAHANILMAAIGQEIDICAGALRCPRPPGPLPACLVLPLAHVPAPATPPRPPSCANLPVCCSPGGRVDPDSICDDGKTYWAASIAYWMLKVHAVYLLDHSFDTAMACIKDGLCDAPYEGEWKGSGWETRKERYEQYLQIFAPAPPVSVSPPPPPPCWAPQSCPSNPVWPCVTGGDPFQCGDVDLGEPCARAPAARWAVPLDASAREQASRAFAQRRCR